MARSSSLPGIPAGSSGQQGKSLGRPERGGHPVTGVGRRPAPCRLQGQATGTHTHSHTHTHGVGTALSMRVRECTGAVSREQKTKTARFQHDFEGLLGPGETDQSTEGTTQTFKDYNGVLEVLGVGANNCRGRGVFLIQHLLIIINLNFLYY